MSEILIGKVKWFNDAKGFGFIEHTSGRDVFVHYSVISTDGFKTLKDGEEVSYTLKEGEKGLHAETVMRKDQKPLNQQIEKSSFSTQSEDDEASTHFTSENVEIAELDKNDL